MNKTLSHLCAAITGASLIALTDHSAMQGPTYLGMLLAVMVVGFGGATFVAAQRA